MFCRIYNIKIILIITNYIIKICISNQKSIKPLIIQYANIYINVKK